MVLSLFTPSRLIDFVEIIFSKTFEIKDSVSILTLNEVSENSVSTSSAIALK